MRDGKYVIAEVGVGPPEMSRGLLIRDRDPQSHIMLFEPNPRFADQLRRVVGLHSNVQLFEVAIGDRKGEMEFFDVGTSSSLEGVASPILQHRGKIEAAKYTVKVDRMDAFDKGDIDFLFLDVEGSEWFCLKHMVSRPQQIVVEVYNDLATYINPYLYEICEWAEINRYKRVGIQDGDFIFQK